MECSLQINTCSRLSHQTFYGKNSEMSHLIDMSFSFFLLFTLSLMNLANEIFNGQNTNTSSKTVTMKTSNVS